VNTLPAFLVEAAPQRVHCTAVALGYKLCLGIFGDLSPLVVARLINVPATRSRRRS